MTPEFAAQELAGRRTRQLVHHVHRREALVGRDPLGHPRAQRLGLDSADDERDGRRAPALVGAADWIWARVQPSAYAHLMGERGWRHADYTERTVTSLLGELTRSSRAPRRRA